MEEKVVRYVARLARIEITSEEESFFEEQLKKIILYVDKLKELDVDKVKPMRGVHFSYNVLREDTPIKSMVREEILKNAPEREGDFFKIPQVIE